MAYGRGPADIIYGESPSYQSMRLEKSHGVLLSAMPWVNHHPTYASVARK